MYLRAIYSRSYVDNFINKWHIFGLFHKQWLDPFTKSNRKVYGFSTPDNLVLSHYKMEDVRGKADDLVSSLLFTEKLSRMLGIHHVYRIYKVLYPERDSSPTKRGWVDKSSGQFSYDEMKKFIRTYVHQINNNKSLSKLIYIGGNIESPFRITVKHHHIYSHCHHASLVMTVDDTDRSLIKHFKDVLDHDFIKIFGYKPKQDNKKQHFKRVSRLHYTIYKHGKKIKKPCTIYTNLNKTTRSINLNSKDAIHRYIYYLLTDYHLQTKDCDFELFSVLNHHQQHLITTAQLSSTKGYCGSNMVSKTIAQKPIKIFNSMVDLASILAKVSNINHVASASTQIATNNAITAQNDIKKHSHTSKHELEREEAHILDRLALVEYKLDHFNDGVDTDSISNNDMDSINGNASTDDTDRVDGSFVYVDHNLDSTNLTASKVGIGFNRDTNGAHSTLSNLAKNRNLSNFSSITSNYQAINKKRLMNKKSWARNNITFKQTTNDYRTVSSNKESSAIHDDVSDNQLFTSYDVQISINGDDCNDFHIFITGSDFLSIKRFSGIPP